MKKRVKIILFSVGLTILVIFGTGLGFFLYLKLSFKPEIFSLENAPQEILDIRNDLVEKLENNNFQWSDMTDFVIFSQYIADNSPLILELVEDWQEIVLFNITDYEYMWFIIDNNSLIFSIGSTPPGPHGILITLNFETMTNIIHREIGAQKAFQSGYLTFEGDFNNVLVVNQIVETAAATLMGTYTPPIDITDNFLMTIKNKQLYIEGGLTLFPYIRVNIDPDHLGENQASTPSGGKAIIVNTDGEILYELENSAHSVHKFINSSSILMGGQEGFMEIWNYENGNLQSLPVPGGHHDFDYNPDTKTIMVLEYTYSNETWDGFPVLYDKLSEYTLEGELVWEWDARIRFPFNETRHTSLGFNLTFRGGADWMHSNSFVWDKENEDIFLNIRNLDTILKIDYNTKDILWEAGRLSNFSIYNSNNQVIDSIFHQPHSLEKIGGNRFIIFDNDLFNESNPDTMHLENSQGFSRFLEFEINETAKTISEIWSWVPKNESYYFPESGGDADRLPGGNTLGIFANKALVLNLRDPSILTEVTRDGQIAWEMTIIGENNTYFWLHRVERFYEKPIVELYENDIDLETRNLNLNFAVWNSYKIDSITNGTIKILINKEMFYQETLNFLPNWRQNELSLSLDNLPFNIKQIQLVIENQDGKSIIIDLYHEGLTVKTKIIISVFSIFSGIVLVTTVVILKRNPNIFRRIRREP